MDAPLKTCVIVPTYNEKENVAHLVEAIEGIHYPDLTVLFVDDGSPDGTADEVRRMAQSSPWVKLLTRDRKMGIGSAYQSGFKEAILDYGADVLVEMDADLQHPPSALPSLIEAIKGGADVAVASRYLPGGGIPQWSRLRRIVSRAANSYSRRLLGLTVRDATSGFRAYTRKAAEQVASADLPAKGFEFQVASLHVLTGKARIVEVPFVFAYRTAGKSKLSLGDILRFLFAVPRIALT